MPSISAQLPTDSCTWHVTIHNGEHGPSAFIALVDGLGRERFSLDVVRQGEAMDLLEAARTAVEGLRAAEADRGRLPVD